MKRATKAIVDQRVEEILRIKLDGARFWDVRAYAREKEAEEGSAWFLGEGDKPISDGHLRRYVNAAEELIADDSRANSRAKRKRRLSLHLAQRQNLYAKSVSQGDIRAALACLDSEAKLTGLFDEEMNCAIEDLKKKLAEIEAKVNDHDNSPKGNRPVEPESNGARNAAREPGGIPAVDPPAGPAGDGIP